jgi:two-component system, NarL family, invasion response regulator UvrY
MMVDCSQVVRLLLVDDHALIRESLAAVLALSDEVVVVGQAGDGFEALELTRRLSPDVVLMDISMPHMSGLEATREVKRLSPQVRVIGLSMHASDDMAEAMIQAGADAFLTKGCSLSALMQAIRSVTN